MISHKLAEFVKSTPLLNDLYVGLRDRVSYRKYVENGSFSQHGEDIFLKKYFQNVPQGRYLDIGCSHPFRISNTYALYQSGWTGVVVDPIPMFKKLYQKWRPKDTFFNVGIGDQGGKLEYFELTPSVLSTFNPDQKNMLLAEKRATINRTYSVEIVSINKLFETHFKDKAPDFMSLDVEGLDLSILKAMDFTRFRPGLISIEFNNEPDRVEMMQHFDQVNYKLVDTIGCNLMMAPR